jgi:TolB-like protein
MHNHLKGVMEDKMRKLLFAAFFTVFCFGVSAQQIPMVAVVTFDVMGGITKDEAQVVTELFIAELVSKRTVNVVDRMNFDKIITEMKFQTSDWSNSQKTTALGNALNAEYVIRGQLMKMGNTIYWTSTMIDVNTAQVLYSAREQLSDLGEVFDKLPTFCTQMLAKLPSPNYFIGVWSSSTKYSIYTGRAILEFKDDGSINVTEYLYTTWPYEPHRVTGKGNYAYDNGKITIQLSVGGFNISVSTEYTFNDQQTGFTLKPRGLPVESDKPQGRNVSNYGTNECVYFEFVKIQM